MLDFEYNIIIDRWSEEYGIDYTEHQRNFLITTYKKAITDTRFSGLQFESFTQNIFRQKYYSNKYPGLDIFRTAYSIPGQN
jgi:hypothetical protein